MLDNTSPPSSDDPLPESEGDRTEPPSEISGHRLIRLVDTALGAQTPVAADYVARLRHKNPSVSPQDLLRQLDRQPLTASTTSGAAVGAAAAAPRVGTAVAAAMSLGEAAVSLQSAVFYVLALTEVHQIPLAELERRRTLVLAILLGSGSEKAIHAVAERTGQHWARQTLNAIPASSLKQIKQGLRGELRDQVWN